MNFENRKWWIKTGEGEEGPFIEDVFQERLRSGEIPLGAVIKSDSMDNWQPLLKYIADDESFRRPSTIPPPSPKVGGNG
jgi:hypothetical protein